MKPIKFKEANKILKPNPLCREKVQPLHVCQTEGFNVSVWKGNIIDRVKFLFTGNIWLSVISGKSQPPVCVSINKLLTKEK